MSYTPISSTDRSFFTREQGMMFTIRVNEELSEANVVEVKRRIGRMPYDWLVINNGIDIRHSLSQVQKQEVMVQIADVTLKDFDYCEEQEIVMLSRHILVDYLQKKPEVLARRGWSTDQMGLVAQVTRMLIDVQRVDKAKIHFRGNGVDKKPLTYTIVGNDEGKDRKASIALQTFRMFPKEGILVVTVLRADERSQSLLEA
jgi:hypothetical protein